MMPAFKSSGPTYGIELELQLIDPYTLNLATDARDLLRRMSRLKLAPGVKPEITQSMIEINSSIHDNYASLAAELGDFRDALGDVAQQMNLLIAGGGAHAFHLWRDRRIFPGERFEHISTRYGYLAKLFTVFGQHIHLGCTSADQAIYLTQALTRYLPQFIALSASSPFHQGSDTSFDSSRLNVVSAFPLSGVMPPVRDWREFEDYFHKMAGFGIVRSMKDFYWDVRPKPEYGTVEIRVCDTPLTVERAAALATYARALADFLVVSEEPDPDIYAIYSHNRFQACRYGYDGVFIDSRSGAKRTIGEDILDTLRKIRSHARAGDDPALRLIRSSVETAGNDARWLRAAYSRTQSLEDTVRLQCDLWMAGSDLEKRHTVSAPSAFF